jgi:hypothetical protein
LQDEEEPRDGDSCCCSGISIDDSRLSLVARPILALTSVVPLYHGSGIWMSQ